MLVPKGDLMLPEGDHVILYSQERISRTSTYKHNFPGCITQPGILLFCGHIRSPQRSLSPKLPP